jgi:hypothetical protein
MAWSTIGLNLFAFWKEYRVIAENTALIQEINQLIREKPGCETEVVST